MKFSSGIHFIDLNFVQKHMNNNYNHIIIHQNQVIFISPTSVREADPLISHDTKPILLSTNLGQKPPETS